MSAQLPANYTEWLQNLPISWLTGGAIGQKWATATGTIVDTYVGYLKDGVKAGYPDFAPVDALPHIGGDYQLIQGSNESNTSFRARLKDVWGQWSRAGTPCSVLEQLWYYGLSNAVWVQQNGLQYTLSGAPTPGADPTSLVVASYLDATTTPLSDSLTGRSIPAGTPWFAFDNRTDMTNRFAIILPSWPFAALAFAYFNGTDSATVTWPVPFGSAVYSVAFGSSTDEVVIYNDGSAQTKTGTTIRASAAWTGVVPVIAFATGINPFNTFSSASLGALQRIISTFRPNAQCMGVFAVLGGDMWDFPSGLTWDGDSNLWDSSTTTQIIGAF